MAMNLWFYVTDDERAELIEFVRNLDGLHILPGHPGGIGGLSPEEILQNDCRDLSCVPVEEVAVHVSETQVGTVRSWNATRTPLIEWKIPYQRGHLIIGGSMRLEEFPLMEPHKELRAEYLATRKMMNSIKAFMAERFVKVTPSLFNGPVAVELMDNGYEGLPFDPETTTFVTVGAREKRSARSSWERFLDRLGYRD
ncbi:MAG: hypothetical protein AAGK17_09065 [Pseudomonadota bacterium]